MNFNQVGIVFNRNMKNKLWVTKLVIALVISNVFFFLLFSGETEEVKVEHPTDWVEIQISGVLLTPFEKGKKILIIQRKNRKRVEGILQGTDIQHEDKFFVLVKDTDASKLIQDSNWEILPFIKSLTFQTVSKGENHEIRY